MSERESVPPTFIVEGHWAVESVLEANRFTVREVVIETGRHESLAKLARSCGADLKEVSKAKIEAERGFAFHRGAYAAVDRPDPVLPSEAQWSRIRSIVIPLELADPGNLGTVIRTAVGLGADAIAVPQGRGADPYNRKCIRASATALFRTELFEFSETSSFLSELKDRGFMLFGSSLGEDSRELERVKRAERMAILFGSEASGLKSEIAERCDESIRIPMASNLDSLNVGASAAIILYRLLQRES